MIFGLPAAALAMYKTARPEKKKQVGGLLLSAALTSMITGITEPLEFTFLFVAPVMYAVHCVLAGLSYMIMHILHVTVGMTFSGGAIDLILFGVLQGNSKTNWVWIIPAGLFYGGVYFFVFYFLIRKFNLKTPGREEDDRETKLYTREDFKETEKQEAASSGSSHRVSALILQGLGGRENLSDVDCCATRLRVTVNEPSLVTESLLKESGASAVIKKGNGVQVIYGPKVSVIKSDLLDFMEMENEKPVNMDLSAYMNGTAIPLSEVEDEVFSQKILGEGVAIKPEEGKLYSPCRGKVEMVFDTKHAINLVSDQGCEILLHIGIDTVKLGGKYFDVHVSDGQEIHKGELLISFDLDGIKGEGYETTTPMIICNTGDYDSVRAVNSGKISVGEKLVKIN